jgi:release factor glutamine methyltransferase
MEPLLKQFEVLKRASLFLEKHHREPKVAELLLLHHLQVTRSMFFTMMRDDVPANILACFEADVKKHAGSGVPVQHLTGYEQFYGREFHVNEHVLIPRPETEELVQHVIERAGTSPVTIADIGTGSGVIAITLALELPQASVFATDISAEAIKVAGQNAQALDAEVSFLLGDFAEPLIKQNIKADIIVSNPPYIAWSDEELLTDTVKQFDPELALFADENGLAAYRKIIHALPKVMKENGTAAFEIGHQQGKEVAALLQKQYPANQINIIKDINGKHRFVIGDSPPSR